MKWLVLLFATALLLAQSYPVFGKFMGPDAVPVDRLVKSAEAFLERHPDDANAHYTLARIHYLTWCTGRAELFAYGSHEPDELPRIAADSIHKFLMNQLTPLALLPKGILFHAEKAFSEFAEARRLDKSNALYALGEASLLEEFAIWSAKHPGEKPPAALQKLTGRQLRKAYYEAYRLAVDTDMKATMKGDFISCEAGRAFVRLAKQDSANLSATEKRALSEIKSTVAKMEKLPMGFMTPLVFSLTPTAHLSDMLAPELTVDFDLRGYGPRGTLALGAAAAWLSRLGSAREWQDHFRTAAFRKLQF